MSDKALIYLHNPRDKQLSCGLYLHGDGWQVKEILMHGLTWMRHGDTHYDFAALAWLTGSKVGGGNRGQAHTFCIYPPPKGGCTYEEQMAYLRTPRDYPGDAGVFLVDVRTWRCECVGGYGFNADFRDKTPRECPLDARYVGVMLTPAAAAMTHGQTLDDLLERQEHDAREAVTRPAQDPA